MPTITLRNTVEAWVAPGRVGKFGDTRMYVHSTANTYVYFNRPNLPDGAVITSAVLRMVPAVSTGNTATTISLHRLASAFDPNSIRWEAQPSIGLLAGTLNRTWYNGGAAMEFNIAADVQNIIDGGAWYGWRISSPSTDATQYLWSGQSATPMELVITFQSPPVAPVKLFPVSNQVVNDPKPTLSWIPEGGISQAQLAIQVQVASDVNFTTNLYTSNEIATGASSLDLDAAAPTFTALTNGQTRWWRVRIKNDMNVWSPYSAGAQFTFQTASLVTVTVPGGTTADPTPAITWTYSGVQKAYQVLVDGPSILDNTAYKTINRLYDSGIMYGTALTMDLPMGVIKSPNETYFITVRVWGTNSVVSVAGVPSYDQGTKETIWIPGGATPPTQLLVTQESAPLPPRLIRWEYTGGTAAKKFIVSRIRDGVTEVQWVLAQADPSVREGATNWYRVLDRMLPGRANITYMVQTLDVNNNTSTVASSPAVTVKVDHLMPWVMSTADPINRAFCMVNADFNVTRGEVSDVVRPVDGPAYLAVQSFGKREGSASGLMSGSVTEGYANLTSAKMKANALWIRENQRVWLSWADNSIEAFVYQVQVTADPVPGTTDYAVSFNFVEA